MAKGKLPEDGALLKAIMALPKGRARANWYGNLPNAKKQKLDMAKRIYNDNEGRRPEIGKLCALLVKQLNLPCSEKHLQQWMTRPDEGDHE